MATKYRPPRGYVESHEFQEDFDAITKKYPDLIDLVGALLWGIAENPFDFDLVPGHEKEGMRVAKSVPVYLEENRKEVFVLRVFFVAPESGPIEITYLDAEAGDPIETDF